MRRKLKVKFEQNGLSKMKAIKKSMMSVSLILHMLEAVHASDIKDSIPFHVANKTWQQETELMVIVYNHEAMYDFSVILGGVDSKTRSPIYCSSLKNEKITRFVLFLQNYNEEERDIESTLLARLDFKGLAHNILKEIKFEIKGQKIIPLPTYGILPPKFEKEEPK